MAAWRRAAVGEGERRKGRHRWGGGGWGGAAALGAWLGGTEAGGGAWGREGGRLRWRPSGRRRLRPASATWWRRPTWRGGAPAPMKTTMRSGLVGFFIRNGLLLNA
uniref:Uncharacterized protein n=1 Tax=Oryza sativa subsp. japonica TaxID=39947 RepID=Q2QQ35_ORYSJ|nr:hypothetical protein LOC_Os12g32370 [Oryza sativa Japonica Group]